MPDRLDIPLPTNAGGLVLVLILAALVCLIVYALTTVYTHPLGHRLTEAELAKHAEPLRPCTCGHDRCRHAIQCVERGCDCKGWVAA